MSVHHECETNCGGTECTAPVGPEPEPRPPRVLDPPKEIWLVYGDLDGEDATHREMMQFCDIHWAEEQVDEADVRYVPATKADAMRALLEQLLAYEADSFDGPEDEDLRVSGADLVDFITEFRVRVKEVLNG